MNDMLSYLLTYKLKGEDAVRESGMPATIIRPCALTEEPSGAPMIVAQGDNIKGKISRRVGLGGDRGDDDGAAGVVMVLFFRCCTPGFLFQLVADVLVSGLCTSTL